MSDLDRLSRELPTRIAAAAELQALERGGSSVLGKQGSVLWRDERSPHRIHNQYLSREDYKKANHKVH